MAISKETAKAVALKALRSSMGDDLERARAAFRGLSAEQMQREHGASGRTRFTILAEYEADRALREEALRWLESV